MITIIQGPAGSGKTTLAQALSKVTGAIVRDEQTVEFVTGYGEEDDEIIVLRPGQRIQFIDLAGN